MKKITVFLWCSVFLCSIMTHAQSSEIPTHLVIESKYGNSYGVSILLKEKPKITFPTNTGEMHITTSENSYTIRNYHLSRMYYKSETSKVENIAQINNKVEQQGDQLCFSTNKPNTHISVIDIKGNILMAETIDSGNYYFSLSDLLPGTYIAKINNTTIKFIKQ